MNAVESRGERHRKDREAGSQASRGIEAGRKTGRQASRGSEAGRKTGRQDIKATHASSEEGRSRKSGRQVGMYAKARRERNREAHSELCSVNLTPNRVDL